MNFNLFSPPTVTYCEKIGTGLIARPFLALSNLGYFFISFLILKDWRKTKLARSFGLILLLVATLSMIYDIRPIYLTQILDLSGMLILINFLLFLDLSKLLKISRKRLFFILGVLLLLSVSTIIYLRGFAGNLIFGSYVLADVFIQDLLFRKKLNKDYRYWVIGFLIFASGFAIWIFDVTKIFCSPLLLLNGRAIFHYFVAITLYYLYIFYLKNE